MQTLANQTAPAAFPQILSAFETARELPLWRLAVTRVGVTRSDGALAAQGVLHDHRQLRLFAIQMQALGYAQVEGREGCDVVFEPVAWTAAPVSPREAIAA